MPDLDTLSLDAPAKINLGLEVVRRRADGFHDINTIFAAIELYDRVVLRRRSDGAITCGVDGEFAVAADDTNLAVRAAHLLRAEAGERSIGVDIELTKRIPSGAGLGGGSSDAAATLRGLVRLWSLPVERRKLQQMALELGSDVPFFLGGGIAHAAGRGERLSWLGLEPSWTVLVVNPGIHVATAEAYGALRRTEERQPTDLVAALHRGLEQPWELRTMLFNDFESAVFERHPLLAELRFRLYELGAFFALMSGSGSTLYGLFDSPEAARAAAAGIDGYWSHVAGIASAGDGPWNHEGG